MDALTSLNSEEALVAGGLLGGAIVGVSVVALIYVILCIVAWWKIFTKAGEAGWKAIIPIYNVYILCRITGINFWIFCLGLPFAVGILSAIVGSETVAGSTITGLYALFFDIYLAIKLGDAFKKGTGFKVGLVLLPFIFYLILAFGDAKYIGKKAVEASAKK
ncbi:signal peptidase I [Candidatus Saccharibacteria bacterium]|nr:signal peptidase I [Candidatus Saccharibacteria bacterium]